MRVLVTGGRNYSNKEAVARALKAVWLKSKHDCMVVIQGGATGADKLAREWCGENYVRYENYPAKWGDLTHPDAVIRKRKDGTVYDAKAGPRRNKRMLDEGQPDLVLAFPGGEGTAGMVRLAKAAGVPVQFEGSTQ